MNTSIKKIIIYSYLVLTCLMLSAQTTFSSIQTDTRKRVYLSPTRIVWKNDGNGELIKNAEILLQDGNGQSVLSNKPFCSMLSTENGQASILLDFGKEIQGGIQIVTSKSKKETPRKIRIRFGESVAEAMSNIDEKGATNDHAMRDFVTTLPWLGVYEYGNTGFRFVRIDVIEPTSDIKIKEIRAISVFRDIPYLGSFKSNDEKLNKIWEVGAYTVQLNMQEYLWDGIKRDRLVWVGDLHPEVSTINAVFGYNPVVPKSLDLIRDITPLPAWMNNIGTYSIWWLIIQWDWYLQNGELNYLLQQKKYSTDLLRLIISKIQPDGTIKFETKGFLDWPSSPNQQGVDAGVHALAIWSMQVGKEMSTVFKDDSLKTECLNAEKKLKTYLPSNNNLKQAAALQSLVGLIDPEKANKDVLKIGGAKGFSTFYGYYILEAMSKANDTQTAIDIVKNYWGAMLDFGATTFWEDFNLDWLPNASRIDELVPEGKKDIHGDYGDYCYKGYRHSLCHGWASGPTSWMSREILGVHILEPGCKKIAIKPSLGNLEWVEGTYPTPQGIVSIRHDKQKDGTVKTKVKAPKGIKIIII